MKLQALKKRLYQNSFVPYDDVASDVEHLFGFGPNTIKSKTNDQKADHLIDWINKFAYHDLPGDFYARLTFCDQSKRIILGNNARTRQDLAKEIWEGEWYVKWFNNKYVLEIFKFALKPVVALIVMVAVAAFCFWR